MSLRLDFLPESENGRPLILIHGDDRDAVLQLAKAFGRLSRGVLERLAINDLPYIDADECRLIRRSRRARPRCPRARFHQGLRVGRESGSLGGRGRARRHPSQVVREWPSVSRAVAFWWRPRYRGAALRRRVLGSVIDHPDSHHPALGRARCYACWRRTAGTWDTWGGTTP